MILGVVLAGGQSRRFGTDKALARFAGESLLERAVAQLQAWCDEVVVVGREDAPVAVLPDWPRAGMGPLAGLAGALRHAQEQAFASVLSAPVDCPLLPEDLLARLSPAPAFLLDQPVIGHWPVAAFAAADAILMGEGRRSMRRLAESIGARAVACEGTLANVNTPEDLAALLPR
ncbi:molybdenum cofactor guanylyltransferase [Novosphingobium mangrovi (ex Hu et al. 2023)]|uniref:Molybdenum cofactor guanylyltransferase n=1 Tax=Novosphingobium mangrovi (ex Hu et al. 2023) TaxID=2930094 RepID=A0ABT0ACQ8_9SPHN|nr:molybdenum cofactor guanylyltransferase [Novosphingobium mangrovi (ex Hu et al. 2023)]MCJ1960964.1 molybdenum cofactor guanylyltransferase [Novosphingobium mangrovi (ex Hu et al. 2023)]